MMLQRLTPLMKAQIPRAVPRECFRGPPGPPEPRQPLARLVAAPEGVPIPRHPPEATLMRQVIVTSAAIGCLLQELQGPCKRRELLVARAELYWLGQAYYGLSLPKIGRLMGDRDHTTVLNGRRRAQAAFRAAGLTTSEAVMALSAEERRAIIAAHFVAVAGRAREDQRSVPE